MQLLLYIMTITLSLSLVLLTFLSVLHGWLSEEMEFRVVVLNALLLMTVSLSISPQTPLATLS